MNVTVKQHKFGFPWPVARNCYEDGTQVTNLLGIGVADRYRTVPEARVVEMLLLSGWAFEMVACRHAEAIAETRAAIARWITLGLGYRRSDHGELCFDPVEVVNFLIWAGRTGLDRFWVDRFVQTGRALVSTGADAAVPARRFNLSLRRRFDLRRFEPGTRVRLRLPMPLAGAYVSDIEISPMVDVSRSAEVSFGEGRMEVRLAVSRDPLVEIGVDLAFTAHRAGSGSDRLSLAERAIYLRQTEGLVRVSARVQALADSLAGPVATPWEILQSCWTYLMDEFNCGAVHYDQVPPGEACDWVLDHQWYDCQLGSALLVSLCRARAIPARIVSGHVLYGLAPTNHFWAEAWIDGHGWAPFDFLSWGLSLGGRDPAWREHFFGKLDFRMVTQVLPLAFTGPMSVRLPPSWHMVQTSRGHGINIAFCALDGTLIYEDSVVLK
jgi:hypothetical protein